MKNENLIWDALWQIPKMELNKILKLKNPQIQITDFFYNSKLEDLYALQWKFEDFQSLKYLRQNWDFKARQKALNIMNIHLISNKELSEELINIPDYPALIYLKGNVKALNVGKKVSIVGTRKSTTKGLENAYQIAKQAAEHQLKIISGLAFGIDSAAHQGCLSVSGETIAVLASGINNISPPSKYRLAEEIIENNGAIISEYPPEFQARKHRFLERNRIIAGLSDATIIIEAPIRSGAINTAKYAFDYNRQVLTCSSSFMDKNYQGNHWLIKNNYATLIDDYDDIFNILKIRRNNKKFVVKTLDETEKKIIDLLVKTQLSTDEILTQLNMDNQKVIFAIANLELDKIIRLTNQNKWQLNYNN